MKPKFENIKTKAKEFMKTDKAKIGGACVCALLICVGVGFGVNAISSQNSQNLPSKALENTVKNNSKTEGENTENKSDNATENTSEHTDDVTVNDKGEVVDSSGNVVAESVEQYNANLPAQSRPVNTSNGTNSVTYTEIANNSASNLGERVEGNTNYGHYERQAYEVKVEDGYYKYIDGRRCNECGAYLYNGQQSVNEHYAATGHGSHSSFQIPTNEWVDTSYTYWDYKNVWVWDR